MTYYPEHRCMILSEAASAEWDGDYGAARQAQRRRDMRIAAGITSRRTGRPCPICDTEGNVLDVIDASLPWSTIHH